MGTGASRSLKADINITPLVDVVLVLLIIFMVITPMMQRGKDVRLPSSSPRKAPPSTDAWVVSLTADGRTFLEKDPYNLDELSQKLAVQPGKPVLLRADESLRFGEVRRVMGAIQSSGARGVRLGVTEASPR